MSNILSISGNLTRDPELKTLPSGTSVCELGICWNENRSDGNGGYTSIPHFFEVSVYGKHGETVARKCGKGNFLTVSGRLAYREWESQDGGKRSKVSIIADRVVGEPMFKKNDGSAPAQASSGGRRGAPVPAGGPAEGVDDDIPF